MNKTLYTLTLATMALGSLSANNDFIKKAVENGQVDVIETCVATDYTVSSEDKQTYKQLAQQIVDKRKQEAKNDASKSYLTADNLLLVVSAIGIVAMIRESYDKWEKDAKDNKPPYMIWQNPVFALTAGKCADSILKTYKEMTKKDTKAQDAVTHAEKVAKAVDELKIDAE